MRARALARVLASALVCTTLIAVPAAAKRRAKKTDAAPPAITHTPPSAHDGAGPLVIEAIITDDSGVFDPALLVRAPGGVFERIALTPVEGQDNGYAAQVPAALLDGDIEYLLEAYDENGNGPARAGEEAAPLRVPRVLPAPPPVTTTTTDPSPAPTPPDDDTGGALVWGAGIVGGVLLLGAAAGIGVAVAMATSTPANVTVTITGGSPVAAAP